MMNRDWMYDAHRCSVLFQEGLSHFIEKAKKHAAPGGIVVCPCSKCLNRVSHPVQDIQFHILRYGFKSGYSRWIHHGEDLESSTDEDDEEEDHDDPMRDNLEDEHERTFLKVEREIPPETPTDMPPLSVMWKMICDLQAKVDYLIAQIQSREAAPQPTQPVPDQSSHNSCAGDVSDDESSSS